MSDDRVMAEVALVRARFADLDFNEHDLWGRIATYPLPVGWGPESTEIAFRFPRDTLAEEPYGFWVRPPLTLPGGGNPTDASPGTVETGFGAGYQQFSWAPDGWHPKPDVRCGTNMLDWVRSFARRLAQVN
jgi:hypothetical protein